MAGPNLEVFKFGVYVFFPVLMMLHYGNPTWYAEHVLPYKDRIFPPEERTNRIPHRQDEVRAELAKLKLENQQRRLQKEREESGS